MVKAPVDSTTIIAPVFAHGIALGFILKKNSNYSGQAGRLKRLVKLVLLGENRNRLLADNKLSVVDLDIAALPHAVRGIVAEHVHLFRKNNIIFCLLFNCLWLQSHHVVEINEGIVDSDDIDALLQSGTQNETTNAAEAVVLMPKKR